MSDFLNQTSYYNTYIVIFLSERGEGWRICEWLVVADRFVDVLLKS